MNNTLSGVILQLINKIKSKICLYYASKMVEEADGDFKKGKITKEAVTHILKEVAKRDPKAVSEFLIKWDKADNKKTKNLLGVYRGLLDKDQKIQGYIKTRRR